MFDCHAFDPCDGRGPAGHAADAMPLQQTALWSAACRSLGAVIRALPAPYAGTALVRHVPVLGTIAMVSRPTAALDVSGAARLRHDLSARHLVVHAENTAQASALAAAGFRRIAAPRHMAELDLGASPKSMAARLSVKWRNRLRHGLRQPVILRRRPFPADPSHWLLRAEAKQARRLGYRPLPPAMIAALATVQPGAAQLFTAYMAGQRVAAMLMLRHGRAATYQIGWTTAEGRAASAGNLLMWRAMLELQAMGVARIDLGLADPAGADGLTRFKCGTGATTRRLGGSWLDSGLLAWRAGAAYRTPCRAALSPPPCARAARAPVAQPGSRAP
ncbi:GNAT family N-acetyltransferase [Roseicyclus elongatus]|uniref:GNAT family N-acetyltransferase n=1 Tax=Roseicyclus elongatus TaxID=159346 RepID=UPI00046CDE4D|nr:GNAT family N-acetyltransferase [Roseibacterium elongatum]